MRENREISPPSGIGTSDRIGKAGGRDPMMNGREKSDGSVVPAKPSNKAGQPAAEMVEGRDPAKGNSGQADTCRTQRRDHHVPSGLDRVREIARRDREARFTALLHHVDVDLLRQAYYRLKPKASPGVDGVTWKDYGMELEENLHDLHRRVHRGGYRAKPSRRVFIPKADGRRRPLGIAALEDKIVQRAVVEVLNAIYEEDFLGFSYGFRPGKSQHEALDALAVGLKRKKVNWVLDADIRGFFDAIDHVWLMKFVEHRIADKRIQRLIQKWLAAGVMEDGKWAKCEEGTPQGATVSPLLANLYLHYALDLWVHHWRKRQARGDVVITRFADDFVVGFQHRDDAERFLDVLRQRMAKFGLELHPEKTRLIEFGRFAVKKRQKRGLGKPKTFSFLGFTHICGRTRSGKFQVMRHTIAKRMRAKLSEVKTELRRRMHHPIPAQGLWLRAVLVGHCRYYAVPTNIKALASFRTQLVRLWYRTLRRRSQRKRLNWSRMGRIAERWLPRGRILHPWPEERFDVRTQGRSPVR
jgi:group II intron reverse transcriptase/maturase